MNCKRITAGHPSPTADGGRRTTAALALLSALALAAEPATTVALAQERGTRDGPSDESFSSTYLSLGHWIYDYVDVLVARGRLGGLDPLVQPYRRIDVARAVLEAEREGQLSPAALDWIEPIKRELADELELLRGEREQEVEFHVELGAGLKALSHTHRDPLRPQGDENLFPTFRLYFIGEVPYLAGVVGGRWDNHLLNDPQFPGGRVIEFRECDPLVADCAYRPEEAYVEFQAPYIRLSFGRLYRNWGLPGQHGLLVSPYAYSYDQIGYRFGSARVALTGFYARLDDFGGDTARHFSTHRFDVQVTDGLRLAFSESVIFGGPGRQVEFNLINPVLPWEISGFRRSQERNSLGMGEIWLRIFDDLVAYGAFMVDNTAVVDEERDDQREGGFNQFAGSFGLRLPSVANKLALRADATVVSSLAYRSRVDRFEFYAVDGIGLARDRTDAVLLSFAGDWFARSGLILKPRLDVLWKGEDDITDPFPADAFTGRDRLFVGTIETTVRPSIGGRYHFPLGEVRWDAGLNFVKNDAHVDGRDWRVVGVGRVEVDLRRRF